MNGQTSKQSDRVDKVLLWVVWAIRFFLVVSMVVALATLHWLELFVALLVLVLTFIASFIERMYRIKIPLEIEVYMVMFIYASLFLGEMRGYYDRFWWWDSIMHFTSAMVFGFIGFLIVYVIYKRHKVKAAASLIALFAFCFAVTIGTIWEIFEFAMDQIFGTSMQPSAFDTMADLILNSVGAAITSVVGYFYIKRNSTGIFRRLVEKFMSDNPTYTKRAKG